jgi:hypothetical protein
MTHFAAPRRRIFILACIGLSASLISPLNDAVRTGATAAPVRLTTVSTAATTGAATPTVALATAAAALTAASPPSAAHPFSDPIWSPLRVPARVNCVRTNCPGPYHGYWAIDFVSSLREPAGVKPHDVLYAAGAGVFHIGAIDNACRTTATPGTWAWIDHGGGRTTQYSHLDEVLAKEGQLVTPAIRIGTIGHSGYVCNGPNYLHMESHIGGTRGPRVAPGVLLACVGSGRVSMPSSLRYAAWDDVPTNQNPDTGTKPNIFTPTATNNCLATSRGAATPNRPTGAVRSGAASATISWGVVPADVNHTVVTIEKWHPSLGLFGYPDYRTVTGRTSSTRFTGLVNGWTYRLRVATHNGAGYSAWSAYVNMKPAAVPAAPRAPRALTTTSTGIQYAWWLPPNTWPPITRFQVARRCVVGGSWSGWAYTSVPAHVGSSSWNLHYNWTGMPRGRTCQVTVRAINSVGAGAWSTRSLATTRR